MRALSIRQPLAEEILLGIKQVEYRTKPCRMVGERFYIYAPWQLLDEPRFRRFSRMFDDLAEVRLAGLPRGVIVGTAVIEKVTPPRRFVPFYHWHLADPRRLANPLTPANQPQPAWFMPF